ncbi:MAG: phosphoribosyl-ATP diphosphatase [Proteobacteria bacterium]|nr:phosphoribosyl-ATP diphosphatase [Pseudomonadota bacterium]
MIIPSIDLMDGQTVQLVGGREKALDAGDPQPLAERFRLAGEIAVIDLDAALGRGSNEALVLQLLPLAACRVGGGIRDLATARRWLNAGAVKVILGTAAVPELLRELPRERVIAALDSIDGEVVVEGWRKRTGRSVIERIAELAPWVGGFLVTFVESEGRMQGIDLARVEQVLAAVRGLDVRVTVAGGVTTAKELATIDQLGADAQVGMALYKGQLELADAITAPLRSERSDGLWPTVVVDERGEALGLTYSSAESVRAAASTRSGVYHSRQRGLWNKGQTSGATQELLRIDIDCDRDALRFVVRQQGAGFCHNATRTCWGPSGGVGELARRLAARQADAPAGSYTRRLLDDPTLLRAKLLEEAAELAAAREPAQVAAEAADVIYFALVALARAGVPLEQVERELDRRALRLSRRPGDAKPAADEAPTR